MTLFSMKYISESIIQGIRENANKFVEVSLTCCKLSDEHIKQLQPCIPHLKRF